jgi:hypothetical protein
MSFDPGYLRGTPAPAGPEQLIWEGRPALRAELWAGVLLLLAGVVGQYALDRLDRAVMEMARSSGVPALVDGLPALVIAGDRLILLGLLAIAGWRVLRALTTRYRLSDQNLYVAVGILNRQHEQLELHRVRDVDVWAPLHQRVLGLAHVTLHSVDRTTPEVRLRAQPDGLGLRGALHQLVKAEQQRLGYREFEGTASLA